MASVEEDGVGVPVGHLSHVLQDVLLGDDSQQPPGGEEERSDWLMSAPPASALSPALRVSAAAARAEGGI